MAKHMKKNVLHCRGAAIVWFIGAVTVACVIIMAVYVHCERHINFCLPADSSNCSNDSSYYTGKHKVVLTTMTEIPGDHGPAYIRVSIDGQKAGEIQTTFNYDTLMNVPPGYVLYQWIDGDIYPDLVIVTSSGEKYFVSSRYGTLRQYRREQ